MIPQVKVTASKPDSLSLLLGTPGAGESQPHRMPSDLHTNMHTYTQTHMSNKYVCVITANIYRVLEYHCIG